MAIVFSFTSSPLRAISLRSWTPICSSTSWSQSNATSLPCSNTGSIRQRHNPSRPSLRLRLLFSLLPQHQPNESSKPQDPTSKEAPNCNFQKGNGPYPSLFGFCNLELF